MDTVIFSPSKGQNFTIFTDDISPNEKTLLSSSSFFPSSASANDSTTDRSISIQKNPTLVNIFPKSTTENDSYDIKSPLLPNKAKGNTQSILKSPGFKSPSGKRTHLGEKSVNQSSNKPSNHLNQPLAFNKLSSSSSVSVVPSSTKSITTNVSVSQRKTVPVSTKKGNSTQDTPSPDLLAQYNDIVIERDRLARALGRQAEEFLLFREAMRETLEAQASKATITAASHAAAVGALRRENDGLMRHILSSSNTNNLKTYPTQGSSTDNTDNTLRSTDDSTNTIATTNPATASLFGKLLNKKSKKGTKHSGHVSTTTKNNTTDTQVTESTESTTHVSVDTTTVVPETSVTETTVPISSSSVSSTSTAGTNTDSTIVASSATDVPHHLILNSHEKESLQNYATSLTLQVSALHKALIDSEARTAVALAAAQRATEAMNVLQHQVSSSTASTTVPTTATRTEEATNSTLSSTSLEDTIAAYEAYLLAIGDNAVIDKVHKGEMIDLAEVFMARTNLLHHGITSTSTEQSTVTASPVPLALVPQESNKFTYVPFTPLPNTGSTCQSTPPLYEKAVYEAVQNSTTFASIFQGYSNEAAVLSTPLSKATVSNTSSGTVTNSSNMIESMTTDLRVPQTVRTKKTKTIPTTTSILQSPGAPDHKQITKLINKALLSPASLPASSSATANPSSITTTIGLNKNKKLLKASKRSFQSSSFTSSSFSTYSRPPQLSSQATVTNVLNNASSIVGAHAQTISQLQSALSAAQACINFYHNATLQVEEQLQEKNQELQHYENTLYQLRAIITAHQITISKHTTEQNHLSELLNHAVQETENVRNINRNLLETSQQAEETLRNVVLLHQHLRQGIQKVTKRLTNSSNKAYWINLLKQDNGMMDYLSLPNEEFTVTLQNLKQKNKDEMYVEEVTVPTTVNDNKSTVTTVDNGTIMSPVPISKQYTDTASSPLTMDTLSKITVEQGIQTDTMVLPVPSGVYPTPTDEAIDTDIVDDEDYDTVHDLVDRERFQINSNAYITSPSVYSVASLKSFSIYQDDGIDIDRTDDDKIDRTNDNAPYQSEFTTTMRSIGSISNESVIQTPASVMTNTNAYSSCRRITTVPRYATEFTSPTESLKLTPSPATNTFNTVKYYRTPLSTITSPLSTRSSSTFSRTKNDYYYASSTPYRGSTIRKNPRVTLVTDFSNDNKENIPLPVTIDDIASQTTTTVQSLLSTVAEILTLPPPLTPAAVVGEKDDTETSTRNDSTSDESPFLLDSIPIDNLIYGLPTTSSVTDNEVWDPKDGFGNGGTDNTLPSSTFSAASLFGNPPLTSTFLESDNNSISMIDNVPIPALFLDNSSSVSASSPFVTRETPITKKISVPVTTAPTTTVKPNYRSSVSTVTDHLSPYRFGLAFNPIHRSNLSTNELLNNATISAYTTACIAHQTATNLLDKAWNASSTTTNTSVSHTFNTTLGPRLRSPAPALVDFSYISPNTVKQYQSLLHKKNNNNTHIDNATPLKTVETTVSVKLSSSDTVPAATINDDPFTVVHGVLTPSAFPVAFPFTGRKKKVAEVIETTTTDVGERTLTENTADEEEACHITNDSTSSSLSSSVDHSFSDSASDYSSNAEEETQINGKLVGGMVPRVVTDQYPSSISSDTTKIMPTKKSKQAAAVPTVRARYGSFKGTKPVTSSKSNANIAPPSVSTSTSTAVTSSSTLPTSSRYAARVRGYSCGTNSIRSRSSSITSLQDKSVNHSANHSVASSLNNSFNLTNDTTTNGTNNVTKGGYGGSMITTTNVHKVAEELHKLLNTVGSGSATEVFESNSTKAITIPSNTGTTLTSNSFTTTGNTLTNPSSSSASSSSSIVTSALTYTSSFLASALPCNKCSSSTPSCISCNTKGKKRSWSHGHCSSCKGIYCSSCIDTSHRLLQENTTTTTGSSSPSTIDVPKICTGCVCSLFLSGTLSEEQQQCIEKILGYN